VKSTPLISNLVRFQELIYVPRHGACQQNVPLPFWVKGDVIFIIELQFESHVQPPVVGGFVTVGGVVGAVVGAFVIVGGVVGAVITVPATTTEPPIPFGVPI
jgi:hypothetical protein